MNHSNHSLTHNVNDAVSVDVLSLTNTDSDVSSSLSDVDVVMVCVLEGLPLASCWSPWQLTIMTSVQRAVPRMTRKTALPGDICRRDECISTSPRPRLTRNDTR